MPQPTVTPPFTSPAARPTASASPTAGPSPHPHCASATPRSAPLKASTDPTERSMPAMMRTNVIPTEITVRAGIWLASVAKVSGVKK